MASPAVCSAAGYQQFQALAGFPPARGFCSTVSVQPRGIDQEGAQELAPRDDFQCPIGSDLCDLLAQLKALDGESARGAWYGALFFFFLEWDKWFVKIGEYS